ncbi:PRC-barrel domain-containing protein [Undibacterium sp. Ji50W]|uniref:PRC-barrel domain-containing protein n=1 Tax=Undibacterium sp. Ji50W TaxID=3413041 RepID=UPI003BF1F629
MINENLDGYGSNGSSGATPDKGPGPELMGAQTLTGDNVVNHADEHLGDIKEIMLDMRTGRVAYAVVAHGGLLTIGEKLFAVPWSALTLDTVNKRFVLNIDKEHFERAPGFDSDRWPDMADQTWVNEVHGYYNPKN